MDEASRIHDFLPISYRTRSEQDYIAFLWDAFESNYANGKYQFAFLAYHMLTMCCVYFNIWQIKLALPREFANAMVGFRHEDEKNLLTASSPFVFSYVGESQVMRFLKLIGCDNGKVGRCAALVKERNNSAHANGNIFYNDAQLLDKRIAQIVQVLEDIEIHSKPVIERCYLDFLKSSQDPEDREYEDDADQIREVLIHGNYLSQRDVEVCIACDLTSLGGEAQIDAIKNLHRELDARHGDPDAFAA